MQGHLFDLYHVEEKVYIWIRDTEGNMHLFFDKYYPSIFFEYKQGVLDKIIQRLRDLKALAEEPVLETRKHFYSNKPCTVLKVKIAKPSILKKIAKKLYVFYGILDIYHTDIDLLSHYMYEKNIFPLCKLTVSHKNQFITQIQCNDDLYNNEYEPLNLKILNMQLRGSPRLGISEKNPILFESADRKYEVFHHDPLRFLSKINAILEIEDPDIILSSFGDQIIFPSLFKMSRELKFPLLFDRDKTMKSVRNILNKGSSYNTYGQWIYRAPSYPLFGRWHLDSANSFVYKETELHGIMELSRLSRIPVQKLARSSTGTALTNIESFVAMENGYLVPWQKSSLENPKTAYELLRIDKGGLIFQPSIEQTHVYENVAQLDFSQMYPSIMVYHNISPETLNCECCSNELNNKIPGTGYHVCVNRRGVVSLSLDKILQRRRYYKRRVKETEKARKNLYNGRQESLKWMLVTSFGYLGYRNAKFGKLESHESVTAWGREKLLIAKECSENRGYSVLHAITDCIFLKKPDNSDFSMEEIEVLCKEVYEKTYVELGLDGTFSWLVFPPSRIDEKLPVMNRYFGRYSNGTMKFRGLSVRRKDLPLYVRAAQLQLLTLIEKADSIESLQKLHPQVDLLYQMFIKEIKSGQIPWKKLLIRKTVSKHLDEYQVLTGTSLSMRELKEFGIMIEPGEKIRYLVVSQKNTDKNKRYLSEEKANTLDKIFLEYDINFYQNLILLAFEEVWQYFAPTQYFQELKEQQMYFPSLLDTKNGLYC